MRMQRYALIVTVPEIKIRVSLRTPQANRFTVCRSTATSDRRSGESTMSVKRFPTIECQLVLHQRSVQTTEARKRGTGNSFRVPSPSLREHLTDRSKA